MKKFSLIIKLCLCFNLFAFAQQTVSRDYKYTVHFETSEDQLTARAKLKLEKRLSEYISKDIQSIRLIGHTDVRGNSDDNMALSKRRTGSVRDFLNQNGFSRFIISTDFKGETEPHMMDDSEEGLQANRRVEIWFAMNEVIPEPVYIVGAAIIPEKINSNPKEKSLTGYQQFHQELDKDYSDYYLNNQNGGLIKAREGSIIYFYPNSFCDCNTQEIIVGKINIQLKEYYRISDFIQAGLNTNSNDRMLQSAGTIHVGAFQNKQKVCLRDRQEYHILFPKNKMNKTDYADMNLFVGNMDDKGEVNWGVLKKNGLENEDAINFLINYGYNCGQCGGYREDFMKLKFFPRVRKFLFNHSNWKFYKFYRSAEGRALVSRNNSIVRGARNICNNERDSIITGFKISFEELVRELKKNGGEWEEYLFSYYITSSSKLNYINCDRFDNSPRRDLRMVKIPIDAKDELSVKIIIQSSNGILSGSQKGGKYVFGKLPKGKKAKLLAYDYSGEKPKLAQVGFRIGEKVEAEDLVFREYSMADFKKHLSSLDYP